MSSLERLPSISKHRKEKTQPRGHTLFCIREVESVVEVLEQSEGSGEINSGPDLMGWEPSPHIHDGTGDPPDAFLKATRKPDLTAVFPTFQGRCRDSWGRAQGIFLESDTPDNSW